MISICVGSIRSGTVGFLIDSIRRQPFGDWELIVVAQGNDQILLDEIEQRSRADARIRLIQSHEFGRSRALNAAIRVAQGDILAFTDDDCEVADDWLSLLARRFAERPDVGIMAGDLIPNPAPRARISTCPAAHTIEHVYQPSREGGAAPLGFYWCGGNVAARADTMRTVGPYDDFLGVGSEYPSCEDVDLALRAEELDITVWTSPALRIYHTYGRRHGLQAFLRHHRGYALGQGALLAKLRMWGHRLAAPWGAPTSRLQLVRKTVREPRQVVNFYSQQFREQAVRSCAAKYELGPGRLLRPRAVAS
ncbi:MAG: glycosyltransferase [Gemmatimonadota bacterium]